VTFILGARASPGIVLRNSWPDFEHVTAASRHGPEALSRSGGCQKNAITSGWLHFRSASSSPRSPRYRLINSLRRSPRMTRKRKLIVGTLIGLMTVLVGSAFALSNIAL